MAYSSSVEKPPQPAGKRMPDDALPKVEPPGAGFIMQLFLIPLIIVMIIVMVWLMFSWLAHLGSDPQKLVEQIAVGDKYGWQKAATLADLLRNPEYEHLKTDPELVAALSGALTKQLEQGDEGYDAENRRLLRVFICRALGEFYLDDALPALLAAATQGDEQDIGVRRTAVESIAVLTRNLGPEKFRDNPEVLAALQQSATARPDSGVDKDNAYGDLRSTAAYALGVLGGREALDRLALVLSDNYVNARYNAATGLARHGDARCLPVLTEMLDPENEEAIEDETTELAKDWKRSLVQKNGLAAAEMLTKANPGADYTPLAAALEKLMQASQTPAAVRQRAAALADSLPDQPLASARR